MINFYGAQFTGLSLHQVGNKHRNESVILSESTQDLDDELSQLLREYFFKPFREKEENFFNFTHEIDLEFNEIYTLCASLFDQPESLHLTSKKIATHLYDKSNHPHIKSGELYVAHFENIVVDNEKVDAIGIFKSELKHDFLEFENDANSINLILRKGISLSRLDKGCLIFNAQKEEGFKVLSVDNNRYDTKYWNQEFLSIDPLTDERFFTKNYLKFCKDFAKDVVLPAEDKQQEVLFMNKAVNHFAKNDRFEESQFLNEVMDNPELIPEFKHYKVERGPKYSIEDVSDFGIANKAVSEVRKKFKNEIHLDTNMHIKLDFINSESASQFIEKGWDEERQMYYYLLYFNQETKK
jgi:hypothetical protein